MLSETHLEQLRAAFPTTEWEGYSPDTCVGKFADGVVVRLTRPAGSNETFVEVVVGDGIEPYLPKWGDARNITLDELVIEVIGAAVAYHVMTGETPALKSKLDFPTKLGLDFAVLMNRLDPRVQKVVDKLLVSYRKSAKADIAEMKRRIRACSSKVDRTDEALTVLRKGEFSPPDANHLHRNIRRDLPAEWCSWSRLGIRAELAPGLTVDVGQAIYTPVHVDAWCVVRVGGHEHLFDAPKYEGLENVVKLVTHAVATSLVEAIVRAPVPALDEAALRALPAWLRDAVTAEIALPEQGRAWGLDVEELVKLRVLLG